MNKQEALEHFRVKPNQCGDGPCALCQEAHNVLHAASRIVEIGAEHVTEKKIAEALNGEVRHTDATTGGQKGVKIERFDLIPIAFLTALARVYGKGAAKYADDNWRKGYPWAWSIGAMFRHIALFLSGTAYDAETGEHHLVHAAWHCITLFTFDAEKLGTDTRRTTQVGAMRVQTEAQPGEKANLSTQVLRAGARYRVDNSQDNSLDGAKVTAVIVRAEHMQTGTIQTRQSFIHGGPKMGWYVRTSTGRCGWATSVTLTEAE